MPPAAAATPKSARGTTPRASSKSGGTPRSKASANPLGGGAKPQPLGKPPPPTLNLNAADSGASTGRDSARKGGSKVAVKLTPRSSSAAEPGGKAKLDSARGVTPSDAKAAKPKSSKSGSKKGKDKETGSPFAPRVAPLAISPPHGLPSLDLLSWTPVASPTPLPPATHVGGLHASADDRHWRHEALLADGLEHRVQLQIDEGGLAVCSILSRYARGEAGPMQGEYDDDYDYTISIEPLENGKWKVAIFEPMDEWSVPRQAAAALAAAAPPPPPLEPPGAEEGRPKRTPLPASTSAEDGSSVTCATEVKSDDAMSVTLDFVTKVGDSLGAFGERVAASFPNHTS